MAGERLIKMMMSKGGTDSDYADVVYGTVLKVKPLEVQLSNQMIITDDFIVLGKHIGKFKLPGKATVKGSVSMSFHGHSGTADISKAELSFPKKSMQVEFDNSLEKGDKVTMIRLNGGQCFYLFEREGVDGYGF